LLSSKITLAFDLKDIFPSILRQKTCQKCQKDYPKPNNEAHARTTRPNIMMIRNLLISVALAAGFSTLAVADATHSVARGETLYAIALKYNTTVPEILAHNGLSSNRIIPGQKLRIPTLESGEIAGAGSRKQMVSYTVKRGDSLSSIASRHKVSVDTLRAHNKLRGNLLHPGQVLFIPSSNANLYAAPAIKQPTATVYTVKRGDTLWDISKRYRISVASLSRYNGITKNAALHPGQKIRIPANTGIVAPAPANNGKTYLAKGIKDPGLQSNSVLIVDAISGTPLYEKNATAVRSIASITKLMTAMVVLDAKLPLDEKLTIDRNDIDHLKKTSSRLPLGATLTRREMLHLALMSSENRASSALARHYPGGSKAFIQAMNRKAQELGMSSTHFADSSGLNPRNVSTAQDLAKMVAAASKYELIRKFSTHQSEFVKVNNAGTLQYRNSNPLVHQGPLQIAVSKTGYINEAGRCLVMQANIGNRPAYMVFLQANGKFTPSADAKRVKQWIESGAAGINLAAL